MDSFTSRSMSSFVEHYVVDQNARVDTDPAALLSPDAAMVARLGEFCK
jgi:hypothetical protein